MTANETMNYSNAREAEELLEAKLSCDFADAHGSLVIGFGGLDPLPDNQWGIHVLLAREPSSEEKTKLPDIFNEVQVNYINIGYVVPLSDEPGCGQDNHVCSCHEPAVK